MGFAELTPRQLAPSVGTSGTGFTVSPAQYASANGSSPITITGPIPFGSFDYNPYSPGSQPADSDLQCRNSSKRSPSPTTAQCSLKQKGRHPMPLSTQKTTRGRIRSTRRTRPRRSTCRPAYHPHRKARSSNSSVRTRKFLPGVQLTCQVFPGSSPSTLFNSFQTQNL